MGGGPGPGGSWNNQHSGQGFGGGNQFNQGGGNSNHQHMPPMDDPSAAFQTLDTAARNKLPPWIRQGLLNYLDRRLRLQIVAT